MLNETNIPLEEDGIEEEILVDEEVAITKAMWGDIGGDMENQTDLQNALDAKQDSLTEAQLNAVNSGITSEKVTTYDGYADQIASKADQSALNAEATTREQADTALGRRIDDEATTRQQADNGLQTQIDAITSKSDVVDVVANYAALQAYDTSSLGNNDVIKVLDDETHEDALTYYRWSTTTQTWSYIGQEAPYYSKGQMDVMLQGKQDKLTEGANIQIENNVISATDTTYTNGNGLNLNGTEFSADTTVLATKEDLDGYYTKPETDNLLAPKLEAEVVAELTTTGQEGKLYLTPKAHTTQTATGNPITATVAEDAGKIESFQLDGDTYQLSYEGKNLLDIPNISTTSSGVDITVNNGVIGCTGEVTSSWGFNIAAANSAVFSTALPAGDYAVSINKTVNIPIKVVFVDSESQSIGTATINAGGTSGTFTTSREAVKATVWSNAAQNTQVDIRGLQVMVESGSTVTSFEPFVGGIPSPNPDYPQTIQTVTGEQTVTVVGKNKYPFSDVAWSSTSTSATWCYQDGGSGAYGATLADKTNYKFTLPAGTYTMMAFDLSSNIINIQACTNGESSEIIVTSPANINSENLSSTITLTEPTTICVRYRTTNPSLGIGNTKIQIEQAESASSYAPYSKQTLPLDIGSIELCKLGDYQDYIWKDGEDWKVHKAIKKLQLTDTTSWVKRGDGQFYSEFWADINEVRAESGFCSHFIYSPTVWSGVGYGISSAGNLWLITGDTTLADTTLFQTWLDTKKPILYQPLATATDTVIADSDLIAQLEAIRTASLENGANTITNTATGSNLAGDMEIGYYGFNPRNRYDKWLWLDINNEYEQIGS